MKLITDEKNVQALFVLVTGNLTGVKFGVEITKDEKKKSVFGTFPVFDLDKGNVLFEPVSMCKFLSLKQKKMNLIPNDTEGILVEEFLEKFGKFESALTEDDFKSFDKTLENDFLVGEKLSLADIVAWCLIYPNKEKLENYSNISKWFSKLEGEKHFNDALKKLGF